MLPLLAESDDMPDKMIEFLDDHGLAVAIVVAVGVFLWKYGGKLIDKLIEFFDSLIASLDKNFNLVNDSLKSNTEESIKSREVMNKIAESVSVKLDKRGPEEYEHHIFSTVATNKALASLSRAVKEAIKMIDTDATITIKPEQRQEVIRHLEEVERILEQ